MSKTSTFGEKHVQISPIFSHVAPRYVNSNDKYKSKDHVYIGLGQIFWVVGWLVMYFKALPWGWP